MSHYSTIFVPMELGGLSSYAESIEKGYGSLGYPGIRVVVKNYSFENWLIADPKALESLNKRFNVSSSFRKAVEPNKADNIQDAKSKINNIVRGSSYHKRHDPVAITAKQEAARIAQNSRSFRRLLRLLGHPDYSNQSRQPAP